MASRAPPGGTSGSGQPRRVRPRREEEGGQEREEGQDGEEEDERRYPLTPITREVGRALACLPSPPALPTPAFPCNPSRARFWWPGMVCVRTD